MSATDAVEEDSTPEGRACFRVRLAVTSLERLQNASAMELLELE